MKLLREFNQNYSDFEYIIEDKNGEKNVYIEGPYTVAEKVNQNNRLYPKKIMEREVYKLQKLISENKLTGDLDHPERADLKLENASHMITSLNWSGNELYGKAKILKSTPKGAIAYGLAKDGVKFGISSRGLGSVTNVNGVSVVNEDYTLLTYDIVASPSEASSWQTSIFESKEWIIEYAKNDDGTLNEDIYRIVEDKQQTAYNNFKKLRKEERNKHINTILENFINSL